MLTPFARLLEGAGRTSAVAAFSAYDLYGARLAALHLEQTRRVQAGAAEVLGAFRAGST
jgi:hypothetical protein